MKSFRIASVCKPISHRRALTAAFEQLESRTLMSVALGDANLEVFPNLTASPLAASTVQAALTPAQVRHAYGFDQITFAGSVVGDGSGQTIAIVDAYDDPNILADLQTFDAKYGISNNDSTGQFALTKVKMSANVKADVGWGEEIALDVQWAHAIAPGAHILLVEAKSASLTDLLSAVDYARKQPGVSTVSMSWGLNEFKGQTSYDSYFTTPAGHAGVTFVAASGDSGAPATWPALASNVVAVGGTSMRIDSSNNIISETGWSGSGGGISLYESQPSYQSGFITGTTKRVGPDVAYDADPNTGFIVYDSYGTGGSPWLQIGGTSAGSPQWAALFAIADQGRVLAGKTTLDGASQALPALYKAQADFRDILSGNNGYSAKTGFDLVTGLGSPKASKIVTDLITPATTTTTTTTTNNNNTTTTTTNNYYYYWWSYWQNWFQTHQNDNTKNTQHHTSLASGTTEILSVKAIAVGSPLLQSSLKLTVV